MKTVQLVDYDPAWPIMFERIRSHVWPAVSDVALAIEHVGSTAVEGLRAKPVIDVCIVVPSREDVPACIERLATIGYAHSGNLGIPDREAFLSPELLPGHHLYVSPRESLSLVNHIRFRDSLRSNPEAVREYGELKSALARRFPDDVDQYIAGKTELILNILEKTGVTDAELEAIRRMNQG